MGRVVRPGGAKGELGGKVYFDANHCLTEKAMPCIHWQAGRRRAHFPPTPSTIVGFLFIRNRAHPRGLKQL